MPKKTSPETKPSRPANRLIREKSPYLRQHARNPVGWYPWGEEAFERARREDKPVFLSIGYSSCHWCHVMERESFDDPEAARLLNETFVCVKVDREERPDLDQYYMTVGQMMTGAGGWPLTIVMTPDKRPFFAGTYLPKEQRWGRKGLMELVPRINEAWRTRREEVMRSAQAVVDAVVRAEVSGRREREERGRGAGEGEGETRTGVEPGERPELETKVDPSIFDEAFREFEVDFDERHGGFGGAPKFPVPHNLAFLMRYWKRTGNGRALSMAEKTLERMSLGGMSDHLGGGFHRYSTDAEWLVPHFEKMLYDQALLADAYAEAYAATGKAEFRRTSAATLDYVLRDLGTPEGGFATAEDADSEGEEGRFYVWTMGEVEEALGKDDAALAGRVFGIRGPGNFHDIGETGEAGERGAGSEARGTDRPADNAGSARHRGGPNILHMDKTVAEIAAELEIAPAALEARLEAIREKLIGARARRPRPFKDTKALADWNGLAIAALAKTARVTGEMRFLEAAERAARFVLEKMGAPDGRLFHMFMEGEARVPAYFDDYAFLVRGLVEVYEAGYDPFYLERALELMKLATGDFADAVGGGFFSVGAATELPVRAKEVYDGAVPSGNSVMLMNLLRLARLTGRKDLEDAAERLTDALADRVAAQPRAHAAFLCGLDYSFGPAAEVVVVGRREDPRTEALLSAISRAYLPNVVTLFKPAGDSMWPGPSVKETVSRAKKTGRSAKDVRSGKDRANETAGTAARIEALAPFTRDMKEVDGSSAAYVCTAGRCLRPVTTPTDLLKLL
jgi:uncharacterized protein